MHSFIDFPQAKVGFLISFVSLYRETHNRSKGRLCTCGVCRMVKQFGEELNIDFTVHPSDFSRGSMEDAFRAIEAAGEEEPPTT